MPFYFLAVPLLKEIFNGKRYRNMKKKVIRLNEGELNKVIKETVQELLNERVLLTEMPYERSDYVCVIDKHARNAYTHLAKLLLYKNTTNDANGWINDIINNFTLPMLTAKVYISAKARAKVIFKGYIENLFGAEFEDYDEQMENFCYSAIRDMEGKAIKEWYLVPQHDDVKQSISLGKNIIVAYAKDIAKMANGIKQETANATLQNTIRTEVKKSFGIDV